MDKYFEKEYIQGAVTAAWKLDDQVFFDTFSNLDELEELFELYVNEFTPKEPIILNAEQDFSVGELANLYCKTHKYISQQDYRDTIEAQAEGNGLSSVEVLINMFDTLVDQIMKDRGDEL